MTHRKLNSETILKSATERIQHFRESLFSIETLLSEDKPYQDIFCAVVERINLASGLNRQDQQTPGKHIHFVAVGKSAGVAKVAKAMFNSIGISSSFLYPTEALHGDLGSVSELDTLILISNQGQSKEIIDLIPFFRNRSCYLIALTSNTSSPLSQLSDVCLKLPSLGEKCPLGQAPITSSVSTLALCQLLVAASMESRMFDLEKYARNHPGGAIGRKIFMKVEDVMIKAEKLPRIEPTATFQKCISRMSQTSLGALLVMEDNSDKLLGLIAERDLRLAMEKNGAKVFDIQAQNFMNYSPICGKIGTLAVEALEVMENRSRPLGVLPILNESKLCVGFLRLHDLVSQGITLT